MAKKRPRIDDNYVYFDVVYEDGSRSSRRKVNAAGLSRGEEEAFALTEIMNQDRRIAEVSGKHRGPVKSMERSAL